MHWRYNSSGNWWKWWFSLCLTWCCSCGVTFGNRPPRFLINGHTEIVVRLKEGPDSPPGSLIYRLRGVDPDGDPLTFGVRDLTGSDVIKIENFGNNEANIYLNKELDREIRDEYMLVITLTDGKLGDGNYITQSLLLLVEDVNDNEPIFRPYQSSISVREDSGPGILTTVEATDPDLGPYGQVYYQLQEQDDEDHLFSVSTVNGKGVIRLVGKLDYEKKFLHQLRILAMDRSNYERINTGTAAILIKVQDVEDQPPEFVVVSPVTRISEDAPVGTSVLKVRAIDGDRGINNKITYSILSGSKGIFDINPSSGIISTLKAIDREDPKINNGAFILEIQAREESKTVYPPPTVKTEVTIIIMDINDEVPRFRSKHYICQVNENAQANTPVTFLAPAIPQVYDHDQGNNGTFEMFLDGDAGVFEVTPRKGVNDASFLIRVKDPTRLDYEKVTVINFTLVARETVPNNPKYSIVPVTVYINDVNDNVPEFSKPIYEASVPENSGSGTTVAIIYAKDMDSDKFGTSGIRYTSLGGSVADMLSLDPVTGVITIKSKQATFDRELIPRHFLTVEARDDLGLGNRNTVQLVINVEDVNDNAPKFVQSNYEARLLENERNFENPLFLEAWDNDLNGTRNSEVRYSILEGGDNFTVDPISGELKPSGPLDFEAISSRGNIPSSIPLKLRIKAEDGGRPSLSSVAIVIVHLTDVNDHSPVFEQSNYTTSVAEDVPGGTSITQVRAWDRDGSASNRAIVYRITEGASDKFTIGWESGIIFTAIGASLDPDLDPKHGQMHQLKVIALDGGLKPRSAETAVLVNVHDVNNKPPVLNDPGTITIKENIAVGTIIYQFKATDPDSNALLRYEIETNSIEGRTEEGRIVRNEEIELASIFKLDPGEGILRLAKILDREIIETIKIVVTVQDLAAQTGIQNVQGILNIIVEDENDNSPMFRKPYYRRSITENSQNGITIANIIADDPDKNRTITYSLQGTPAMTDLVHLDSTNGELVVGSRIDREQVPWMNFTVKATDSGLPPRSSFVDVYIQVNDENDNNPYFISDINNITVWENVTIGTNIAKIEARDADIGDYGKVTYLLDRRSSEGKFQIHPETGVLNITDQLDREEKSSYLLIIQAWDNYQYGYASGESRNAFKQLLIRIMDVNDEAPVFIRLPETCVAITEFHEPRDTIILLKATDKDDPETPNGQISFSILAGNEQKLFELETADSLSARLLTSTSLKSRYGNYSLTVQAADLGKPAKSAIGKLDICVTDFNDNPPVFITPSHNTTIRIPENATVGSVVIGVEAVDHDVGQNAAISYRLKQDLTGDWKTFSIDSHTGIITLKKILDRETQKIYQIRVEAYDHGVPTPLASDLDLTIFVRNINDYQPQFLIDEQQINFTENALPGSERRQVIDTVDEDEIDDFEEPQSPVCYYIISGNEERLFNLEPLSHQITVNGELDRETADMHVLIIKATEDCSRAPQVQTETLWFDPKDDTTLRLVVNVEDVNDNPPKFVKKIFTGGVTTESDFGTEFMQVRAIDRDLGKHARINYYQMGETRMTLGEGMENIPEPPFIVDRESGGVFLNFDPQKGMKGYFDFKVVANDSGGLSDTAHVFIYLLREDQRVRFVLRQHPPELRENIDHFRDILGNVTGAIVNIDLFKVHESRDGRVDKTRTDLYMHFVDPNDHSILEVQNVLKRIDQNIEHLDGLFKEFNVLDTQAAEPLALARLAELSDNVLAIWLGGLCMFLGLLLAVIVSICLSQRSSYKRQIKAATVTAFGSTESELTRTPQRVPNTNKHSVEGSNPIWMQAYENEWYKDDTMSQASERDSLDENAVVSMVTRDDLNGGDSSCNSQSNMLQNECPIAKTVKEQNDINSKSNVYHRNIYQHMEKLGNPLILSNKKLETTEL